MVDDNIRNGRRYRLQLRTSHASFKPPTSKPPLGLIVTIRRNDRLFPLLHHPHPLPHISLHKLIHITSHRQRLRDRLALGQTFAADDVHRETAELDGIAELLAAGALLIGIYRCEWMYDGVF